MAFPIRHLLATAFLGEQEGVESVLLSDIFSSGGSSNVSTDKDGRVAQILGYVQTNAAPVTTNTGAAATRLRALQHFVSQAGGVITRQEIGIFDDANAHWEFRKSTDTGATWTFVDDAGAGSINTIPDFAQFGNLLFMTNGVVAPQQWDGTTKTTAGSTQLAAPTYTKTGAGTLSGNIGWRVLPMVGNVRKLASVQSLNYALNLETGHIDWVADADVTVTSYEAYRTTGTGLIFYFEGAIVGRLTVTFTVGAAADTDTALIGQRVLQEFGDAPPVGAYFCEPHKQRMFYGRTNANPRTWYWSDPGTPFSVYSAFNKVDFTDAESFSDFSTGATGDFQGMFVVWLERSVWTLSGDGSVNGTVTNWQSRRTNAQSGTVTHRSVTKIPAGAKYTDANGNVQTIGQVTLAYLTPHDDVRIFDGDSDTIISHAKHATLQRLNYTNRAKSFCVHDRERQEVTWIFPGDTSTEPNLGVTWNYRYGSWCSRSWPFAHAIEVETINSSSVLLAGEPLLTVGGLCYQLWSGYTLNGLTLTSVWMTEALYGQGFLGDAPGLYGKPLIAYRKRWRQAMMLLNVAGGQVSFLVEWIPGDDPADSAAALASHVLTFPASVLETSDGSVIETSDNSVIETSVAAGSLIVKLEDANGRYVHSRGLRIRITASTLTGQWFMSAMDVMYQLLPGLKRSVNGVV